MKNFKKLMAFGLIALSVAQVHSMSRFMPKVAGLLAASSALALRAAPASVDQDSKSEPTHEIVLYRFCNPDNFNYASGECDEINAQYIRNFDSLRRRLFVKNEKFFSGLVNSNFDKYRGEISVGFEIRDIETGEIVVRRDLARENLLDVGEATSLFTVSAQLTPKKDSSQFEIFDNRQGSLIMKKGSPHIENDRFFSDTLCSAIKNHTLGELTLRKGTMHGIIPFQEYYLKDKIADCKALPKAQRDLLKDEICEAEKSLAYSGKDSEKIYCTAKNTLTRAMNDIILNSTNE